MQAHTHKLCGSARIYITTALLLLSSSLVQAQSPRALIVGTWEGVMFTNDPGTNGTTVQFVFSPQGKYTCMLSNGVARHWGSYQVMGNEIELEIKGHQPESITMPRTDRSEIVSLTASSLITRQFAESISSETGALLRVYCVTKLRRVQ